MPIDLAGKPPILLYKDGSSDPSRNPRHMVGAVLRPHGFRYIRLAVSKPAHNPQGG